MSILLAGLAFVVSFASLWLTSLRRPKVEVEHLPQDGELTHGATSGDGMPDMHRLILAAFVYNAGASATVVRSFKVEEFREHNTGTPLFVDMEPPHSPHDVTIPFALERDDATSARFRIGLRTASDIGNANTTEYARRLAALRAVHVTLRWSYRGRRFPFVWRRVWKSDREPVSVSGDALRERVLSQWRGHEHRAHLVRIVEAGGA